MKAVLDRRFILVVGKGGVGRSTVAASVALKAAESGKRTLLYQANAKDRFGAFFGKSEVGTEIVQLKENLFSVNATPDAALEEYGMLILRFRRVYKMVFENRISEAFLKAVPGIEDYAILGKAWYHTKEEKRGRKLWDTIIFDMAASGHSLSMLQIPWAISRSVPEGPLTRDAKTIQDLLLNQEETGTVLVTMAEDMPSNEARDFQDSLKQKTGMPIDALVINQLYSSRFASGSPQERVLTALSGDQFQSLGDDSQALIKASMRHNARRLLNEDYLEELGKRFLCPTAQLPRLFVPTIGEAELRILGELLEGSLL